MKSLLFLTVVLFSGSVSAQDFEVPTIYKVEEVVPENLRSTNEYRLGNVVGHNGYLYLFNVYSIYGDYSVTGLPSLENLAFELKVLTSLHELESSQVFLDAAAKGGVDIVFAPLKTVGSIVDAVVNPSETWETIKDVPDGVVGWFDWASNRLGNASDDVKDTLAPKTPEQRKKADSLVEKGAKSVEKFSLDYLGYNKLRRAWCEKTSIDPFTENQPLRDRITRLAEVETAANVGFKFVPTVIDVGVVGKIKGYMDKTKKVSLYADPMVANDKNKVMLMEMGIPEEDAKRFTKHKKFSSTMRTLLVHQLDEMPTVENKMGILTAAFEITSKEGALYMVQSLKYLVQLQIEGTKFLRFLLGAHVIAAVSSNGELIIPMALDRIIWTKEMQETIDDTVVRSNSDSSIKKIKIITSAKLSERMKAELGKRGIGFSEGVFMDL